MVDGLQTLTKKQLMAKLRDAQAPEAQLLAPPVPQAQARDWSHRKAEWICSQCNSHNFVSRLDCRQCQKPWSAGMRLIPAGTAPQAPKGAPRGPPAPPKVPPAPEPASMRAAELALEAAKKAAAPTDVIAQWEKEVQRRKQVEEIKVPPTLRSRLATATSDANTAMQARERAQRQAESARAQLEKAEEALQAATAAEQKAAAALKEVTAEVAPNQPPDEAKADALCRLTKALDDMKAAIGTPQEQAAGAALEAEHQRAKAATAAKQHPVDPDIRPMEEEPTVAHRQESERLAEARKQEANSRATALMSELESDQDPEAKEARLAEALNQAWGDRPFADTQAS